MNQRYYIGLCNTVDETKSQESYISNQDILTSLIDRLATTPHKFPDPNKFWKDLL